LRLRWDKRWHSTCRFDNIEPQKARIPAQWWKNTSLTKIWYEFPLCNVHNIKSDLIAYFGNWWRNPRVVLKIVVCCSVLIIISSIFNVLDAFKAFWTVLNELIEQFCRTLNATLSGDFVTSPTAKVQFLMSMKRKWLSFKADMQTIFKVCYSKHAFPNVHLKKNPNIGQQDIFDLISRLIYVPELVK
jgi:hypothetical protein